MFPDAFSPSSDPNALIPRDSQCVDSQDPGLLDPLVRCVLLPRILDSKFNSQRHFASQDPGLSVRFLGAFRFPGSMTQIPKGILLPRILDSQILRGLSLPRILDSESDS